MNAIGVRKTVGLAALAACLVAVSALAQMGGGQMGGGQMGGGGMGMPNQGNSPQTPGNPMPAPGQQPPGMNMPGQQNLMNSMTNQDFLRDISQDAEIETTMSQLAWTNSSNENIQVLAQHVIAGHQKLASEISDAAARHNLSLSDRLSGSARKDEKKMKSLTARNFDGAYLKRLHHYVQRDQNSAKQALSSADTPDMRQLAMEIQSQAEDISKQMEDVSKAENISLK